MRHNPSFACLAYALCFAVILPLGGNARRTACAQASAFEGREIIRIDFDVPPELDIARVRRIVSVRVGDIYRGDAVRRDVAAIHALGQVRDVQVIPALVKGGVALTYRILSHPTVGEIRFEGRLAVPEKTLRGLLEMKVGQPADPYAAKMDRKTIAEYYHDRGYFFADVACRTNTTPEATEVVYHIQAGSRLTVESIRFRGNDAIPDKELRRQMISGRGRNLFTRGALDPALLGADLRAIRERFRRKGYLDATVGHEMLFDEMKQRAYLTVDVRQGRLYTVERLLVRGALVYSTDELLDVIETREGGPFAREQLEEDIEAIRDLYGRKGHIKAAVRVDKVFAEERPAVTLHLRIEEGPVCSVNKVMIRGNWRTKEHVIRRDISLIPGEIVNTDEVGKSKRRLVNTGLFFSLEPKPGEEPVAIRFVETDEPDKTDVAVEVTEGGLGNIAFGAGWSSTMGLIGNINLVLRNFDALDFPKSWKDFTSGQAWTGGAQELSISLSPGTDYRDYRLGWKNPRVWDSPYYTGFDLYMQDFVWADYYDHGRAGLSLMAGRRFGEHWQATVSPQIERVKISDIDAGAPPDAVRARGTHNRRALATTVAYDDRDNIFLPTSGQRVALSAEMGGTVLGGDVDFLRETLEARKYWTVWDQARWGRHVVNIGGQVGVAHSTNSGELPIFERFFVGGLGSLRGFRYRRVGPVDAGTLRQIGGEYMALLNAEYEAPLLRDIIRGVLFVDSGTLARSFSDADFSTVRAAAGGGVRFRIPQLGMQKVPIGLYVATPLRKEDNDKTETISFSIGTGFEF